MPLYNYDCTSCGVIFEELVAMDYYEEPQEHDYCGNLCERTAEGQGIYAHGIGLKEHSRATGSTSRKNVEEAWMKDEIENTKKAVEGKSGISPYTRYEINHEVAVERGIAKKVDPKTAKVRQKSSEKLTHLAAANMSEKDRKRLEAGHNTKNK